MENIAVLISGDEGIFKQSNGKIKLLHNNVEFSVMPYLIYITEEFSNP